MLQQAFQRITAADPPPEIVSLLDAPMGDWFWMPGCLEQVMKSLPPATLLRYHGVDVAPTAVRIAESRRDEVLERLDGLTAVFSMVDLSRPSTLARSVRGERIDVVLCHDLFNHLFNHEILAALRNVNQIHSAKFLVTNSYLPRLNQAATPSNQDALLTKLLSASPSRSRHVSHPVDLTRPPFVLTPLEGRGRMSILDTNLYENVRLFRLPLDLTSAEIDTRIEASGLAPA